MVAHRFKRPWRGGIKHRSRDGAGSGRTRGDLLDVDDGAGWHGRGLLGSTLAQLYKVRDTSAADAVYRDGPAFYITGGAMVNEVKRGLFSNEAGMGSAPNIASAPMPNLHHASCRPTALPSSRS